MSHATEDMLSWYVVHTHRKQEDRTKNNLQAFGVETLMPKLRTNKYNEFTGQLSHGVKPLFPNYIFTRFKFNDLYHRIRFTRGVQNLICFNNKPAPVDNEVIDLIRARMGSDGFVKMNDDLNVGDEVVITDRRFQNLCGIFERESSDTDRVSILLNAVGFQAHVVVNRNLISRVAREERAS
jgi:transcriptional antiterminator RfaH